jgi:hypothetical protein
MKPPGGFSNLTAGGTCAFATGSTGFELRHNSTVLLDRQAPEKPR